jgi:hypothetical protein
VYIYLLTTNMKRFSTTIAFVIAIFLLFSDSYAQTGGHRLQVDDGSGHFSLIVGGSGGTFTLPNSGGGMIMTSSGGTSPVWLLGGNNNPTSSLIGTLTANDFSITTFGTTRATFSNTPSSTTPMLALMNTTAGIQGVHIYGSLDATTSSTLPGNPGVWDLVVDGDEVVTGILKAGSGSLWIDGRSTSAPHTIKSDQSLNIMTSTNDSIMFGTNGSTKMTIASNGYVGIGTVNPQSPLHIKGQPPESSIQDAIPYFYLPDPVNHVLTVENTASGGKGNGIAIIVHNPASSDKITDGQNNNEGTNYITFYNDVGDHSHIRGRIESFSYQNFNDMVQALYNVYSTYVLSGDIYNPFNYFKCNLGFDTHFADGTFNSHFMDNAFNSGFLNSVFTLPTLPTFNSGSFPTISFSDFQFTVVTPDAFPNINVDLGNILPSLSGGSLPSLTGGSVGSICFSCMQNPLNLSSITSPIDFTKFSSPITNITNPFSLNYGFIDSILSSIAAIPYKQKLIDIISNGPKMAVVKAAAAYATAFFSGGVTYESGSGDYAEWLERADHNENIGIGDVVGVTGGKISKNTDGANEYMVASWKPCVLGNMPEAGKEQFYNKVAFMGQVPIKLYGSVKKGDCIVPSGKNDGFAKAVPVEDITAADLDKVLGVSWQDDATVGVKIIKIAVGLKPHEMAKVMKDQAQEIDQLKAKVLEIDQLKNEVAQIKSEINPVHHAKFTKKKSKHAKLITSN